MRHLKCRQQYLLRDRLACSFAMKKKDRFWSAIKKVNKPNASLSSIVDGVSGTDNIANLFASKFGALLNKHSSSSNSILDSIQCSLTDSHLRSILITPEQVLEALSQLKPDKTDPTGVSSKHLLYGSSVLAVPLSALFTSILRHGFMPDCLRDSIVIPVPKSNKDSTKSLNYRPISLSSTLSKVLERLLLSVYDEFLSSSHLQFGFKRGFSTSLCTATIKTSLPTTSIVALLSLGASLMPVRLLILLIMASFLRSYWNVGSLYQLFVSCYLGIPCNSYACAGTLLCLIHSKCLMVCGRG